MSKTRFDRKKREEQWKSLYTPLQGGLDQTSSALAIDPGRVTQSLNYEEVFGKQGYRTIAGYERYDGQARPSKATYSVLNFTAGTAAFAPGDVVSNLAASASGTVAGVTVTSGSFGALNAAGYLVLVKVTGTFANADQIRVSGTQRATTNGVSFLGTIGFAAHIASLKIAREFIRALIQKVPGEGSVLGGAVFNGRVYAVRNVVGSTSATLWRESGSSWVSVMTGLIPGGVWRFKQANFTGSPTNLFLYGTNGRSRMIQVSAAGATTKASPIFGSEALSTSSVVVGTGSKSWTITPTAGRNFNPGDDITVWGAADATNFCRGTVTTWTPGSGALVINVTSVGGAGTIASWEVGRSDFSDKPFNLLSHKNTMFWAYPNGQLQTSDLGDPLNATTTASLFGAGEEISDLLSLRGEILGLFTRTQVKLLRGSSKTDWLLGNLSQGMGAQTATAQDNGGNALFMDTKGLTTLQSTQAFGDFAPAVLSPNAKLLIDSKLNSLVGTRMAKNNYQYRLYYTDGTVLRCTIQTGAELITSDDVSFMPSQYVNVPTCMFSGVMADGFDRMFFGSADGYVMEEDVGTSFDGTAIYYSLRLPFNHIKSAAMLKDLKKLELELDCPDAVTLYLKALFDYDDGTYLAGGESASTPGVGGQYDAATFDQVQFDLPANSRVELSTSGICRNVGLLLFFSSDYVRPVNMQGLLWYYVLLGLVR